MDTKGLRRPAGPSLPPAPRPTDPLCGQRGLGSGGAAGSGCSRRCERRSRGSSRGRCGRRAAAGQQEAGTAGKEERRSSWVRREEQRRSGIAQSELTLSKGVLDCLAARLPRQERKRFIGGGAVVRRDGDLGARQGQLRGHFEGLGLGLGGGETPLVPPALWMVEGSVWVL